MSTDRLTGTTGEISTRPGLPVDNPSLEYRLITVDLSDGKRTSISGAEAHLQQKADAAIASMVEEGWSIADVGGMWGNRVVILFQRRRA